MIDQAFLVHGHASDVSWAPSTKGGMARLLSRADKT
jgi:hypothetical protein